MFFGRTCKRIKQIKKFFTFCEWCCFFVIFEVLEQTNATKYHKMNAIEFKNGLTISKFRKSDLSDYEFDINENTYYVTQWKPKYWCAYDPIDNEDYCEGETSRKDVVNSIVSGLYYQHKHGLND